MAGKNGNVVLLVVVSVLTSSCRVLALNDSTLPAIFYPFGSDEGDSRAMPNDDGFTPAITIPTGFPFFNTTRSKIFVNTNGAISFDAGVTAYIPNAFPIPNLKLVAPFWVDIDTTVNKGRVYYRQTTDDTLLQRASRDIQAVYSSQGFYFFKARWVFIATWHNVTHFGGSLTSPYQSFQCVLATDGIHSFALFNYGTISWTTGLASNNVAAQVGFNAGDGVNFYAIPFSRKPEIRTVDSTSNVEIPGRWAFRVDNAVITPPGCATSQGSECMAWQIPVNGKCSNVAPTMKCPRLTGPKVINRLWFEFYCELTIDVMDKNARYEVTFTFDGVAYNDIPVFAVSHTNPNATLHEKYLHGRMGKWIGCQVVSFWANSTTQRSFPVRSENTYKAGVEISTREIVISELDSPANVTLVSTIPITCRGVDADGQPINCGLPLHTYTTKDIVVRQRPADTRNSNRQARSTSNAVENTHEQCAYLLSEEDWKSLENLAYSESPLDIQSTLDVFVTQPRLNTAAFATPILPLKTVNGETYPDPWSNYTLDSRVNIYRHDVPADETVAHCKAEGDPHITTFDKLYYHTQATGVFIYVRTTDWGIPVEVHVGHWKCGEAVSCICGVAIREDNTVRVATMCKDSDIRPLPIKYLKYEDDNQEDYTTEATVTESNGGQSFMLKTMSGHKVIGTKHYWGMNINIYIAANRATEGLCGSFDGNPLNDMRIRQTKAIVPMNNNDIAGAELITSWNLASQESLLYGVMEDLGLMLPKSLSLYCQCASDVPPICGTAALIDRSMEPFEPNLVVKPRIPVDARRGKRRKRAADTLDEDDLYDYTYQSTKFTERENNTYSVSWPTASGLTQEQAQAECRSRIYNMSVIGPTCYNTIAADIVDRVVQSCVDDVQLSDSFSFVADKIPELQRSCVQSLVGRNNSHLNDTQSVINASLAEVRVVTDYTCEPPDCSGHGLCRNGTCDCSHDYIPPTCAVSRSAVPSNLQLLDPATCDIRARQCQSVYLSATNVAGNVTCRIEATQSGKTASTSYNTQAQLQSGNTVICPLPTEPLSQLRARAGSLTRYKRHSETDQEGVAVLTYRISISNNQQSYSPPVTLTLVDTQCTICTDTSAGTRSTYCLMPVNWAIIVYFIACRISSCSTTAAVVDA